MSGTTRGDALLELEREFMEARDHFRSGKPLAPLSAEYMEGAAEAWETAVLAVRRLRSHLGASQPSASGPVAEPLLAYLSAPALSLLQRQPLYLGVVEPPKSHSRTVWESVALYRASQPSGPSGTRTEGDK